MPMLTEPRMIRLLGDLRAEQGDRVITRFRRQKAQQLLAYLALHLDRSHTRTALIEQLWPDQAWDARKRAQVGLRVALDELRRRLEPPDTTPPVGTPAASM